MNVQTQECPESWHKTWKTFYRWIRVESKEKRACNLWFGTPVTTYRLVKRLWLWGAHVQVGHHGLESFAFFRQLGNTKSVVITMKCALTPFDTHRYNVVLTQNYKCNYTQSWETDDREPPQHPELSHTLTAACRHTCSHLTLLTAF